MGRPKGARNRVRSAKLKDLQAVVTDEKSRRCQWLQANHVGEPFANVKPIERVYVPPSTERHPPTEACPEGKKRRGKYVTRFRTPEEMLATKQEHTEPNTLCCEYCERPVPSTKSLKWTPIPWGPHNGTTIQGLLNNILTTPQQLQDILRSGHFFLICCRCRAILWGRRLLKKPPEPKTDIFSVPDLMKFAVALVDPDRPEKPERMLQAVKDVYENKPRFILISDPHPNFLDREGLLYELRDPCWDRNKKLPGG